MLTFKKWRSWIKRSWILAICLAFNPASASESTSSTEAGTNLRGLSNNATSGADVPNVASGPYKGWGQNCLHCYNGKLTVDELGNPVPGNGSTKRPGDSSSGYE